MAKLARSLMAALLAPFLLGSQGLAQCPDWAQGFGRPTPGVSGPGGYDSVFALTTFDDGSGPALYAGGDFSAAGDKAAFGIARWDGSSWSPLGSGVTGNLSSVLSLAMPNAALSPAAEKSPPA